MVFGISFSAVRAQSATRDKEDISKSKYNLKAVLEEGRL